MLSSPQVTEYSQFLKIPAVEKKKGMAELYTGDLRAREMLKDFILSERSGVSHYLCSKPATYIGGGKEIGGSNMEVGERRTYMRIQIAYLVN